MSAVEVLTGAAVVGAGFIGYKYFSKQSRIAEAEKKERELEDEEAKKAADKLKTTTFFSELNTLRGELEGELVLPTDGEKYHECRRRAFNLNQRGFPLCVVRVKTVGDVSACVRFAGKFRNEINLCVASGGHSSKCMMSGSFVIDLKNMNKTDLNLENLTVTVEGGAYLEEVDKVLEPHNLGVTVGTYPQTGVGGLVLGGGFGFLARMFGFSVDNFLEAEIVLPTGKVVWAKDDNEYSDLIWGLRGGTGNFGIVTKFVLKVYKLPTYCVGGIVAQLTPTFASAMGVVENFDKLINDMPNNVTAFQVFLGGDIVCPSIWAHFGEEKSVSEIPLLQKATKLGGWITVKNDIKATSYHKKMQTVTTPLELPGHIYQTLIQFGELGKPLPTECWEKVLTFTRTKLHHSLVKANLLNFTMGGKIGSTDLDGKKTSIPRAIRGARYFGIVEVYWKPEFGEEGKNAAREWARTITKILKPYSNEALRYAAQDSSAGTADVIEEIYKDQAGYGKDNYPKLRELKKKYDPSNMFKNNVNIAPAE